MGLLVCGTNFGPAFCEELVAVGVFVARWLVLGGCVGGNLFLVVVAVCDCPVDFLRGRGLVDPLLELDPADLALRPLRAEVLDAPPDEYPL